MLTLIIASPRNQIQAEVFLISIYRSAVFIYVCCFFNKNIPAQAT